MILSKLPNSCMDRLLSRSWPDFPSLLRKSNPLKSCFKRIFYVRERFGHPTHSLIADESTWRRSRLALNQNDLSARFNLQLREKATNWTTREIWSLSTQTWKTMLSLKTLESFGKHHRRESTLFLKLSSTSLSKLIIQKFIREEQVFRSHPASLLALNKEFLTQII